jgi:hypothetical protein
MSKSKKQITNEKRQRLGTGAGIASNKKGGGGSGFPLWGWFAGVIAIVVIVGGATAFMIHGRNSSGQTASCVQSRLSKDTLDPLSQPTWPANYDDLQCALNALGLAPSQEASAINHYHVHLTLYVDGRKVQIPDYIGLPEAGGMTDTATSEIHTHGRETDPVPGIIHIESGDTGFRANLQQFFDVWGVYAADNQLGGYQKPVKVWINGEPVNGWLTHPLQKHNAITMVVGDEPANFKPDKSFQFPNGE